MSKVINKNIGLLQKAQILDEAKRIIRLKASDSGFDRDNDRLNAEGWKMPDYNIPFVDSHKTHSSMDKRLGEVINAFFKDGFWWNDVQLDIPPQEIAAWTEGEKLANRIWNMAKDGKDIRTSVGFIPNLNKITQNEKGGIDYAEMEQTELSAVLMPSNSRAGNKATGDISLTPQDTLEYHLKKAVIEKHGINERQHCDINAILMMDQFIYNIYGDDERGYWFDKYYKIGYNKTDGKIILSGDSVEVQPSRAFVEKLAKQEQAFTKLINTMQLKMARAINKDTGKNNIKKETIDIDAMIQKAINKSKVEVQK